MSRTLTHYGNYSPRGNFDVPVAVLKLRKKLFDLNTTVQVTPSSTCDPQLRCGKCNGLFLFLLSADARGTLNYYICGECGWHSRTHECWYSIVSL